MVLVSVVAVADVVVELTVVELTEVDVDVVVEKKTDNFLSWRVPLSQNW